MTTKFCVIGSPINHSLSPNLHTAAYQHLGLDFSYEAREVPPGNLERFLTESEFSGASVTMPLKKEAFDFATQHSDTASTTSVVNTLLRSGSGWRGSNTDVFGLEQALAKVPPPRTVSIIGSGATTTSALAALRVICPDATIVLLARNHESLLEQQRFADQLGMNVSILELEARSVFDADLVLSLVPAGSFSEIWAEISEEPIKPSGWLFDVSYSPWPSEPAIAWGTERVISGIEMLIWQAINQIEIFVDCFARDVEINRSELYQVMSAAVSLK
ncbi:unannotated protein [freshwater metagenome]|uniref:Unannotated protein n=1 Tax=freshwater metagenome TaxID=449393 RepID=A0A6J6IZ60_9ZZZZ|nr:shikimate dehydrogenase [Actinomycetota bacterium]